MFDIDANFAKYSLATQEGVNLDYFGFAFQSDLGCWRFYLYLVCIFWFDVCFIAFIYLFFCVRFPKIYIYIGDSVL